MKKMLAALLAAILTLCFTAALAEDTGPGDVKAKGTFVMGFDEEYPPMGFVDENGKYVGFDIDLAKEVTDRLGVELVLQPVSWDSKELELSGKNIDCIWSGLTMTPERIEQMTFSIPYLANEQILVVRSDSGIASEADLSGKVLGTQAGSSSVDVLNANPDLLAAIGEPQLYDDFVTALMDLKLGGIDVLLIDSVVGNYYIAQQDDPTQFTVLPEVLEAEEYGIAFRKGEQTLARKGNGLVAQNGGGNIRVVALGVGNADNVAVRAVDGRGINEIHRRGRVLHQIIDMTERTIFRLGEIVLQVSLLLELLPRRVQQVAAVRAGIAETALAEREIRQADKRLDDGKQTLRLERKRSVAQNFVVDCGVAGCGHCFPSFLMVDFCRRNKKSSDALTPDD